MRLTDSESGKLVFYTVGDMSRARQHLTASVMMAQGAATNAIARTAGPGVNCLGSPSAYTTLVARTRRTIYTKKILYYYKRAGKGKNGN